MRWVDIWEQLKPTPMLKDSIIGLECLICALTADCITCQNNKPKPKHRNEFPLEEWQNDTIPFRTVHIDHKGPLHPPSNRNLHCLLVIDACSRFLMVYPVTNASAQATIAAVEKWIHSFGIRPIYHTRSRHRLHQH